MKKYQSMGLGLLLAAGILSGCRSQMPEMTTAPTRATTTPTVTAPTTAPTAAPTRPTSSRETIEDGNGPIAGQRPGTETGRR